MVAAVLVPIAVGAPAVAQTTTTDPLPVTTTTSSPPPVSTSTPPPTTTPTTSPIAATPRAPADSATGPTAAEDAAARSTFAGLTTEQRRLLQRLQQARDAAATARGAVLARTADLDAAATRLDTARVSVQIADSTAADLKRTSDGIHAQLTELAAAMYQSLDSTAAFKAVNRVDASDRGELSRARVYANAPRDELRTMVAWADATKQRLASVRDDLDRARSEAATAQTKAQTALAMQRAVLTAAEDADATAAAAVTAALGSGVALLAEIADPHFGPDFITEALAVVQAGEPDPLTVYGAFRLPTAGFPLGSPYGKRVDPLTGSLSFHPGIDLEAPAGAEVHAAASGAVVIAGDCGGYGTCVVVAHDHALATVYAHLRETLVTVGQPVADGQVVGLVGSTGMSTGPHLHFEVRFHGVPIDPIPTLTS
jgi:murein DD-endopeptidase MepM/ murein hydrolase activator NlpD